MEVYLDAIDLPVVSYASVGQLRSDGVRFRTQEQSGTSQQVGVEHLAGPDVVRCGWFVKCFHVVSVGE